MEFENKAHEEIYQKISQYMRELFGEMANAIPDQPRFVFRVGTTLVHINVWPWGDDDGTVTARAYVVTGAELVPDLLTYLLRKNNDMRFGAFGVDEDGDIFFEHSIVGSTCDKEELKTSILAVGQTADHYDEQIVSNWGGLRIIDHAK